MFTEKAEELTEVTNLCKEALSADSKAKRGNEREVFVCIKFCAVAVSHQQTIASEKSLSSQVPVRFPVNILIIYLLLKFKFMVEHALNTINTSLHLCVYVNLI